MKNGWTRRLSECYEVLVCGPRYCLLIHQYLYYSSEVNLVWLPMHNGKRYTSQMGYSSKHMKDIRGVCVFALK